MMDIVPREGEKVPKEVRKGYFKAFESIFIVGTGKESFPRLFMLQIGVIPN